jgi:D-alanine-D-alanine ligase-like ATP-grasp enzyme
VHEERSRDWDKVVDQVARALRKKRHKVSILGVHKDYKRLIRSLERQQPDLIFNLLEEFGDDPGGNIDVCGLLDLMGMAYTGCGPGDYYLGQDKALAKRLLAFEGILPSSTRTRASRPAATCACRCSSSRSRWTRRSASARSRWCATRTR